MSDTTTQILLVYIWPESNATGNNTRLDSYIDLLLVITSSMLATYLHTYTVKQSDHVHYTIMWMKLSHELSYILHADWSMNLLNKITIPLLSL